MADMINTMTVESAFATDNPDGGEDDPAEEE